MLNNQNDMEEADMEITTKLKTIFAITLIVIAGTTMGCLEPRIPAAAPTPTERVYSTIWCGGTMSVTAYSYDDECLGHESVPFSDEMPYTEYDWTEEITIEEMLDLLGIPYNRIDTEYESVERPTADKVVCKGRYVIYGDGGYLILNMYYSGTRY